MAALNDKQSRELCRKIEQCILKDGYFIFDTNDWDNLHIEYKPFTHGKDYEYADYTEVTVTLDGYNVTDKLQVKYNFIKSVYAGRTGDSYRVYYKQKDGEIDGGRPYSMDEATKFIANRFIELVENKIMDKKLEKRIDRLEKLIVKNEATDSSKWDGAIIRAFKKENGGEYDSYYDWKDEALKGKLKSNWYSDSLTSRIFGDVIFNIEKKFLTKYETGDLEFDVPEFPELNNRVYVNSKDGEAILGICQIQDEDCWNVEIRFDIQYGYKGDSYFSEDTYFTGKGVTKKGTNYECLVSYFDAYENFLNTTAASIMGRFIEKYKSLSSVDIKQLNSLLSSIKDLYAQYKAACNDYINAGGSEDDIEIAITNINKVI